MLWDQCLCERLIFGSHRPKKQKSITKYYVPLNVDNFTSNHSIFMRSGPNER